MSINRAEKTTLFTAITATAGVIAVRLVPDGLHASMPARLHLFVHTWLDLLSFAMCFAMLVLSVLLFPKTLSRQRLYTAALLSALGLIDAFHALTANGMPFAKPVGGASLMELLGAASPLVGSVGLFVIFRTGDRPVPAASRLPVLSLALGLGLLLAAILSSLSNQVSDGALSGGQGGLILVSIHILAVLVYLLTTGIVLHRSRNEMPQALPTIVQSLVFFLFANLDFTLSLHETDASMLISHVYKLAGYYLMMKGIYAIALDEPCREKKRIESRIRYLAAHDELTGLSNRRQLNERLSTEIEQARQSSNTLGVLLLDIDRFKTVNEALGHTFGDRLLLAVSERLKQAADNPDLLFRMGGDEFILLLTDLPEKEAAEKKAQSLIGVFDKPFVIGETEYHLSVSIGISFFPKDGETVDALLKNADTAMYSAKAHRNEYSSYMPHMNGKAYDRLQLESDLRRAVEQKQFTLAYQPLINLNTGSVVGVEALVRWHHPHRGLLPPGEFIPLSEENGLILPLGEWVLRAACLQNKAWQDAGLPPMTMSVNLSMRQFRQQQLAQRIKTILEETGMPPEYLELEITESMTTDVGLAAETLASLKRLGIKISIDDFGTGYSSLVYLKQFPIDKLKIDKSFVREMTEDSSDAAIVATITSIARQLKLKVTAEGVENDEQIRFLRERQCEEAQGYYFTKPIPAGLFENWYRHRIQSA